MKIDLESKNRAKFADSLAKIGPDLTKIEKK